MHTQASRSILDDQHPIYPISQHDHFRNILNNCRSLRNFGNRWHMVYHVLPLEELAISILKHKIDYTQFHTQPKQIQTCMYMKECLPKSRGSCRTCGEGSLVWLLASRWWGHGNSGNTLSLHVGWPLLCCLSFETWQREGERENGWLLFCGTLPQNFLYKKLCQNTLTIVVILSSKGREETSPSPLPMRIKVI
jgi:hypothetical protein